VGVKIVNMIPNSLSGEITRDSEPNVAVNPANRLQIASSVFTPDPMSSGNAPIYVSIDGGDTWVLNVVLPGGNKTNDTSLRFAGTSSVLYAGILRIDNGDLNILRTSNFTLPGVWSVLVDRASDDQPWVEAATVMGGGGTGADRVYIGNNDLSVTSTTGKTATVDASLDAATGAPPAGFGPDRLEPRATATVSFGNSQDGPSIRPAIHSNGTIYAAYFGWRTFSSPTNTTDVVVVRDNDWASGLNPFNALLDAGDGQAGVRVVTGVSVPSLGTLLGTQRIGSHLAIAVDPTNSANVYLAWADGTSAANYTIHVRRSLNSGQTWNGDLRTIVQAVNPGLAVTQQGRVGLLYQRLHNPGSGNRWQTHLETSDDGSFAAPADLILADVPDFNGTYAGINPIGDYANVVAVGKDFYGVFCGNNTPDLANFPNGVTYQRNADFVGHVLKDLSNNPVGVSIDPFFFHVSGVAVDNDFYVRDWTDSASSGDDGSEPSTHPVFYTTGDVWNRRGTMPGPFPSDQPSNEPAGNGAGNIGDNWAFARIRRNAPAAAGSTVVTAHFLVSKFGTGSNYVDNSSGDPDVVLDPGDPTLTFSAADVGPTITPAYHWHLSPVASTHLCLAVEISAPGDPFIAPSLVGSAPGWPTTDLRIINDNNKAQRNMGLSTTPARGVGMSDCCYAIVHNAATFTRDVVLRCTAPADVERRIEGALVQVVGGETVPFKSGVGVSLANMLPGENRWIGLVFTPPPGTEGEIVTIDFDEMVGDVPVNGFAMGAQLASPSEVVRAVLEQHRSAYARIAFGFDIPQAREELAATDQILAQKTIPAEEYVRFLAARRDPIERTLSALVSSQQAGDPFGLLTAIKDLLGAIDGAAQIGAEEVAVVHECVLNRVDSFATMVLLLQGDVADILQNVRWQRDLFVSSPVLQRVPCLPEVLSRSNEFIARYGVREIGNGAFSGLIQSLLGCFEETAAEVANAVDLKAEIQDMQQRLGDLTALQHAHRQYLLKLHGLTQAENRQRR
jgi:hypothetical protein